MEIEKLFNDLESNQSQECEEAKKKLVDLFNQTKDAWLVHGMMDYFLKTGSMRIMEVLVKVQSPHDNYIFDKLCDWLKSSNHRLQALTLFGFVVRKHPTWLYKIEKHKIIKDILKLLQTEKEIVLLMSALLCIVTLLPVMPMIGSNFLNELFEVFGHLAQWNNQNLSRISEDKVIHLKLGLQMLFNRLYGMYPCNFLTYLSEFTKKGKETIFQSTIKPLLDTVRVHPMLITANSEKEMNISCWKHLEPHDLVAQCAKLSVADQDVRTEFIYNHEHCFSVLNQSIGSPPLAGYSGITSPFQSLTDRELSEFKKGEILWSPYNEIMSSGSTVPHTPTPSFGVPLSSASSTGPMSSIVDATGSSPPEAAVEATPETTPLKELNMKTLANPHAVCAIFTTSQPTSPMRRDPSAQFTYPESPGISNNQLTYPENVTINKIVTKLYDQRMQHVLNDRHQVRLNALYYKAGGNSLSMATDNIGSANDAPQFDCQSISQEDEEVCGLTRSAAMPVEAAAIAAEDQLQHLEKCVPMGRNRSIRTFMRKNRLTSCCHNDYNWNNNIQMDDNSLSPFNAKVRRAKSCPAINDSVSILNSTIKKDKREKVQLLSSKLSSLPSSRAGAQRKQSCSTTSRITQTIQTWPNYYEGTLFDLISENNKLRAECNTKQPQDLLNQYIEQTVKLKDHTHRMDQEQVQLMCLQLQYEKYRREIHAERNRRLMGRSRKICSSEHEQNRLKDKLKIYDEENRRLLHQIENTTKLANEMERRLTEELNNVRARYQEELEHKRMLQLRNETLQSQLNEEIQKRMNLNSEVDLLRGQIFDMRNELQQAQMQAEQGQQCKQELVRLESEFLVMGEVQIKLRDRLTELDNLRARDEEINHLQESYHAEIKEFSRAVEEKASQLEIAKHKLSELHTQIVNNEKVMTDQKRLLKHVKDEYEEKFKALNSKYEVQKALILQMEEKLLYLYRNQMPCSLVANSPDTDRGDIASSIERNSPLSASLASSDSLPASLRSVTEIRNLQAFAEPAASITTATLINNSGTSIHYHPSRYHPTISEGVIGDSFPEVTASTSATHTLDIPTSVAGKSHYHQQKQKALSQSPRTVGSYLQSD